MQNTARPAEAESKNITSLTDRNYGITRDEFVSRFIEPWDREYADDQGMLDKFYVDDEVGYDALLHIFCGETSEKDGVIRPFGFHLETASPDLTATRSIHIPDRMISDIIRQRLEKQDFEPYNTPVQVQGHFKKSHNKVKIRGGERVAVNTMFGRAYDAFSIMKNVTDAVASRDVSQDVASEKASIKPGLVSKSFVFEMPILGTDETAPVKIFLEDSSDKIISANPILRANHAPKLGSMSLATVHDHLLS